MSSHVRFRPTAATLLPTLALSGRLASRRLIPGRTLIPLQPHATGASSRSISQLRAVPRFPARPHHVGLSHPNSNGLALFNLSHQPEGSITTLAFPTFRRGVHQRVRASRAVMTSRRKSTKSDAEQSKGFPQTEKSSGSSKSKQISGSATTGGTKTIFDRLPHITQRLHRPSKEELLAAATGFWSRFRVHFKWFSIRDMRPFNMDDISAFFSWILLGHVVWILVGGTTFLSLCILLVNTVFAQETLARWVGNYLTQSSGVQVVFESAIVPKWKDGVISFKNVFVSRRPGQGTSNVSKGSPRTAASAAAAAAAAAAADLTGQSGTEDTNYTQFDLSINTVNVTVSFAKWFNGKGLLCDVDIDGVRGVVDRRSVQPSPPDVDPKSYRHEHTPGDFEIESFKLQDLLITVYQPGDFRPFPVSIYSCDLPQLRKQFLFYDFLSANNMSGSFDDSLFSIHPRQSHNYRAMHLDGNIASDGPMHWKKHQQIRIDGLNIDHLNRGVEGPFSWIHEGNVDIIADIMLPADDDDSITKVMSDFYDRVEATVTTNAANAYGNMINNHPDSTEPQATRQTKSIPEAEAPEPERFLIMDLRVHLNDVRAGVPIFTRDISYVNNALIRPIVAYINSKRTFIPVTCRVVKNAKEFDGSWTIYDSGLLDDLSREMYEAFARDVVDDQARRRRIKKVGIWTIQLAAQALFIGLAGNFA